MVNSAPLDAFWTFFTHPESAGPWLLAMLFFDASLLMICVDPASGRRVDRTLYPKQSDSFDAPYGCLVSVVNPVTEKALFRHKVLEPMTTLAVTEAILLRDGEVGSTGKWYDSRAACIALGASVVIGVVALAILAVFLVNKFAKDMAKKKMIVY